MKIKEIMPQRQENNRDKLAIGTFLASYPQNYLYTSLGHQKPQSPDVYAKTGNENNQNNIGNRMSGLPGQSRFFKATLVMIFIIP